MSLINREALLSFEKMDADLCATCGEHHTAEDVIMMIKTAPTVDDVPVVRCRECKKKNKKKCPMTIVNFGRDGKEILVQNHVPDDFYCAAGERKEGADNG